MPREFSAGGVVVRRLRGRWWVAAIRPGGKPEGVWALPKGLVGRGEPPEIAAGREVAEETGIEPELVGKLGDVKYWYQRDGKRVFKNVSFFQFRYVRGSVRDHDHEVEAAEWIPLADAPALLAYRGEKQMAEAALTNLRDSG